MNFKPYNPDLWKISQKDEREYSIGKIKDTLTLFNKVLKSNFYVVDYQKQQFIVGDQTIPLLSGYPHNVLKKEQFDFFSKILSQQDHEWFLEMRQEAFNIFYRQTDLEIRMNMELEYGVVVNSLQGKQMILHHRLIPYNLDANGNLWRSLLYVWPSLFIEGKKRYAKISNIQTGNCYKFIEGDFKQIKQKLLTPDEVHILEYTINDIPSKQIYELLQISKGVFESRKRSILKKLEVTNLLSAVVKATRLGHIRI